MINDNREHTITLKEWEIRVIAIALWIAIADINNISEWENWRNDLTEVEQKILNFQMSIKD